MLALGVAFDSALIKGCETRPPTPPPSPPAPPRGEGAAAAQGSGVGAGGRHACLNFAGPAKCQDCFGH